MGAALHRQLFFAFAISIIVSIAVVAGVFKLLGDGGQRWRRDERALGVLARRFARHWEDPMERRALAADLGEAMGGGVRIVDAQGRSVEEIAWTDDCHWHEEAAIVRGGSRVGEVSVCFDGTWPRFSPWIP